LDLRASLLFFLTLGLGLCLGLRFCLGFGFCFGARLCFGLSFRLGFGFCFRFGFCLGFCLRFRLGRALRLLGLLESQIGELLLERGAIGLRRRWSGGGRWRGRRCLRGLLLRRFGWWGGWRRR